LTEDEKMSFLKEVKAQGWRLEKRREAITRDFEFGDFVSAFGFMSCVALKAEKYSHHPEWSNLYNKVKVTLTTHENNGFSNKDVQLARFIQQSLRS